MEGGKLRFNYVFMFTGVVFVDVNHEGEAEEGRVGQEGRAGQKRRAGQERLGNLTYSTMNIDLNLNLQSKYL